jgi:hypothetical protein
MTWHNGGRARSRPGWSSVRVSRITSWPGGGDGGDWPDEKRPEKELWDEWNRIRVERGGGPARTYYKAHKDEIDKLY